jgi:uncharacterized protein YcfJ
MIKTIVLLTSVAMLAGCTQDTYVKSTDGNVYRVIEKCDTVRNPNYGRTSASDLLVGGLVGGAVGKTLSGGKKSSTVAGGLLGALIASEPRDFYVNCREELRKVR